MSDERATVEIDRSKSDIYDSLTKDESSFMFGVNKVDVFILAAAIGFHEKQFKELPKAKKDRQDLFVTTLTLKGDNRIWILKSIAIASSTSIEVLKNMGDVISVCEKYANYGIDYLDSLHKNSDNETDDIAIRMMDVLDEGD